MLDESDDKNRRIINILGKFYDCNLEKNYHSEILRHKNFATIIMVLTTIYCLANLIYCISFANYQKNVYILIISLFLLIISCAIILSFLKGYTLCKFYFSIYFFYVLFFVSHYEFNYQIDISLSLDQTKSLANNLEYLFMKEIFFLMFDCILKHMWILTPFNDFLYFFATTSTSYSILFYICYLRTKLEKKTFVIIWSAFLLLILSLNMFSLIIMKIKKKKFYFKQKHSDSHQTKYDIVDFFNSGYIKLQNYSVVHKNDFFDNEREIFSLATGKNPLTTNFSDVTLTLENSEKNNSQLDIHEIIKFLFSNTTNLNPNLRLIEEKKRLSFGHEDSCYFRVPDCSIGTLQNFDVEVMNRLSNNNLTSKSLGFIQFKDLKKIYDLLIYNKSLFSEFNYYGQANLAKNANKILSLDIIIKVGQNNDIEIILNDITKKYFKNGINQFVIRTGQFLHDFKNPLICIHNEIAELKDQTEMLVNIFEESYQSEKRSLSPGKSFEDNSNMEIFEEKIQEMLEKFEYVKNMSEYCQSMIGSYEDFSKSLFKPQNLKIENEKFDLFKILRFLRSMMSKKLLSSKKNVKFFIQLENFSINIEDKYFVYSDESKLKRVLINLLSNAEKFTLFGSITLKVSIETVMNCKYIIFSVQDTGYGMNEDDLKSLFTPFFSLNNNQSNKNGCGLGLTIVKEITEKLGRGLKISSELSKGTKVTFDIQNTICDEPCNDSELTLKADESRFNKTEGLTKYLKFIDEGYLRLKKRSSFKKLSRRSVNYSSPLSTEFLKHFENYNPRKQFSDLSLIRPRIASPKESKKTINIFNSYLSNASYIYEINKNYSLIQKIQEINFEIVPNFECEERKPRRSSLIGSNQFKIKKKTSSQKNLTPSDTNSPNDIKNNSVAKKIKLNNIDSTMNSSLHTGILRKPSTKKFSFDKLSSFRKQNILTNDTNKIYEILIVDNEQSIRSFYKNVFSRFSSTLERVHFEIEEADDGLTGLSQIFRKAINSMGAYDLIICDDLMTFLDGIEMFKILSFIVECNFCKFNLFENILSKFVFCSSDTENVKTKLGKDIRICDKPLTTENLKKLITFN